MFLNAMRRLIVKTTSRISVTVIEKAIYQLSDMIVYCCFFHISLVYPSTTIFSEIFAYFLHWQWIFNLAIDTNTTNVLIRITI